MTQVYKKHYGKSSKLRLAGTLLVSLFVLSFVLMINADYSRIRQDTEVSAANSIQIGTFNPLENQSSPAPSSPPGLPSPTPTIATFLTITPTPPVCEPKKFDCGRDFQGCLVCKKLLSNCKIKETKDCPSC